MAAPSGEFELATCRACGFSWNAAFEPARVVYDQRYDNHAESPHVREYHRSLARMLIAKFKLVDGTVYDVGCGKGEFLRELASLAPGVRCVGIDPSCTPIREANFELVCSHFDRRIFTENTRLVLLRHVLEHINSPLEFLVSLREAMPAVPLFVEVPDLEWTLDNGAFWDFCYEHCNYFTRLSLKNTLFRAGFGIIDHQRAFGEQYQWALALPIVTAQKISSAPHAISQIERYVSNEAVAVANIARFVDRNVRVALWGMSTKGVLLSTMLREGCVAGGIDTNVGKQGRFAAGSGVAIHAPSWIAELQSDSLILVMNPNYLNEIKEIAFAVRSDLDITALALSRYAGAGRDGYAK